MRFAAANFDATLFDTNDLATLRGSSLALLRAPDAFLDWIRSRLTELAVVDEIYSGASESLIRIRPFAGAAGDLVLSEKDQAELDKYDREIAKAMEGSGGRAKKNLKKFEERKRHLLARAGRAVVGAGFATKLEPLFDAFAKAPPSETLPLDLFTFTFSQVRAGTQGGASLSGPIAAAGSRANLRQFQTLTVTLPPDADGVFESAKAVCALDRVSPALPDKSAKRAYPISASALRRQDYGREMKNAFYGRELDDLAKLAAKEGDGDREARFRRLSAELGGAEVRLAADFSDMIERGWDLPASLKGKMALIHLDGNGFQTQRVNVSGDIDGLQRFSRHLQLLRGDLLADLLDWMRGRPDMLTAPGEDGRRRYRFETLLWGGDEVLFVLPAWAAWEAMGVIQKSLATWRTLDGSALHASAGMLIADHKTPIKTLTRMAGSLCDAAKHKSGSASIARNLVQAAVLDLLDEPEAEIGAVRRRLFGARSEDGGAMGLAHDRAIAGDGEVPQDAFSLSGADWPEIAAAVGQAKKAFGRSQLYRVYHELLDAGAHRVGRHDAAAASMERAVERLRVLAKTEGVPEETLDAGIQLLSGSLLAFDKAALPVVPLHQLLEFWDAIEPDGLPGREDGQ